MIDKLRPFSKAIAALVSVLVGVLIAKGVEVDGPALEAGIIAVLTAVGVFAAPANK